MEEALPQELMEDILSRLPVKWLLRFKTASKRWYSFISENHDFAKFNFKQSFASSSKLFSFHIRGKQDMFQYSDVYNNESRKIKFPVQIAMPCRLIGSANGLICLCSGRYKWDWCYIWNPCTGECKSISVPFPANVLFGFGYDSISDDYKIIGVWKSSFHFFSLKTNSWKRFECSLSPQLTDIAFHSNGALHWYVGPYWYVGPQIAAFDLAKDKILFLDLPEGSYTSYRVPLFDYQGSLCTSRYKSIWVMKEYGNSKSWAKLTTSLPEEYAKPVCFSEVGEVVFHVKDGLGFVKSDIQGRISDEDKLRLTHFGDIFEYKESLISPKCFDTNR